MDGDVLCNEAHHPRAASTTSLREFVSTTVMFHKISYTVPVKKTNKVILDDCSGVMRPGLNAILGPTGSGKTSLLDILAARKDKRYLMGNVLVNGEAQPEDFRLMSGFVVQDDTVWGTLSVRENLNFSASLRLGRRYTSEDRKTRVDTIIDDLGLTYCAETKVGTDESRGISGGERKRTCIGMELVTNPDVLFLDEPTTGLDATTAVTVIELLQKQAKRLRTIVFSIHQPRYSIFKLFDHITLLSQGKLVYAGSKENALDYFEKLGYKCEMYNNPADHLMDVITAEEQLSRTRKDVDGEENGNSGRLEVNPTTGLTNVKLADHYRNSNLYNDVLDEVETCVESLQKRRNAAVQIEEGKGQRELQYQSSFFKQFGILSKRTLINIIRDPRGIIGQFFITIVMALIVGAIYFKLDLGVGGLQNRVGVMFFLVINMIFSNLSAIAVFLEQRRIFRHESANGYYRVSAYFLSKVLCDTIPMRVIPATVLSSISYFLIGLQPSADKFFIFLLTLIMTTLPAASVAILASSSTSIYPVASILVSLSFVFMMLFSGFLVRFSDIPVWLHWLKYFSIFKYGLINLQINELHGLTFMGCGHYGNETCPSGDMYLKSQDIDIGMGTIWTNVGALAAITCILLFLSYVQLRRIKIFI